MLSSFLGGAISSSLAEYLLATHNVSLKYSMVETCPLRFAHGCFLTVTSNYGQRCQF